MKKLLCMAVCAVLALSTVACVRKKEEGFCSHNYRTNVVREATCTEKGVVERICEKCEDKIVEYTEMTVHTYENDVCTVCGAEKTQEPETSVDGGENESVNSSEGDSSNSEESTEGESTAPDSSTEGDSGNLEESSKGESSTPDSSSSADSSSQEPVCEHEYEENVIRAATCKEGGIVEDKCKHCGDTKNLQTTPKTDKHTYEDGKCTVCGQDEQDDDKFWTGFY